jgi:hypothetical protein
VLGLAALLGGDEVGDLGIGGEHLDTSTKTGWDAQACGGSSGAVPRWSLPPRTPVAAPSGECS